jgi:hypothetical protein
MRQGYFKSHYMHFFPKLSDRSSFVRQAANLWQVKSAVQKRLAMISGEIDASKERLISDIAQRKTCIITDSNWACVSQSLE